MSQTPDVRIIGRCQFTDGSTRKVFEDAKGRQHVGGDHGEPIAGQWMPPADEAVIAESEPLQ